MNQRDINKLLEAQGTKLNKDRLMEQIRRSPEKDFAFIKDEATKYLIVRVKVS